MSFLRHIAACNNYRPAEFVPFFIADGQVGRVRPAFAELLRAFADVFTGGAQDGIALRPELDAFDARSAALAEVVDALAGRGILQPPMGEPYPVTAGDRDAALCVIDRSAASWLGLPTFGQHLNGYLRTDDGLFMWVGRRARDRRLFPGRLDQLVAGGLPFGISPADNLAKECYEEAGIDAALAARAVPVGRLRYFAQTEKGAKPDTLFCYDLELPEDFQPRCTDGEVESFHLMPVAEVVALCRETSEFKPNCSLVALDFLLRHGVLDDRDPEHALLQRALYAPQGAAAEVISARIA